MADAPRLYPHKTALFKILILYFSITVSVREANDISVKWQQTFPEFNFPTSSCQFLLDALVLKCPNLATLSNDRYYYTISVLHAGYEKQTSASISSTKIPY
jgi:hypothetical protein